MLVLVFLFSLVQKVEANMIRHPASPQGMQEAAPKKVGWIKSLWSVNRACITMATIIQVWPFKLLIFIKYVCF